MKLKMLLFFTFLAISIRGVIGGSWIPLLNEQTNTCSDEYQKEMLGYVNQMRKNHGSSPVSLSKEHFQQISAQQIANFYAARSLNYHDLVDSYLSPHFSTIIYGHPLVNEYSVDNFDFPQYWETEQPVKSQTYRYYLQELDGNQIENHQFTTLIWNSSRHLSLGCAIGYEKSSLFGRNYYVVLNFDPPGNIPCGYKRNVLPSIGTDAWKKMTANPKLVEEIDPICAVKPQQTKQTTECPHDFTTELLYEINSFRTAHGTSPLFYSPNITKYSQEWANFLAARDGAIVLPKPQGRYGHNLVYAPQSNKHEQLSAKDLFTKWSLSGGGGYFGYEPNHDNRARYRDVMSLLWAGSKEIGIACASVSKGFVVVVNFDPPGNRRCEYLHNVRPEKSSARYGWLQEHRFYVDAECAVY